MSFFFKNAKKFSIFFTSVILAVTLTAGSFAVAANGLPDMQADIADEAVVDMTGSDFDGESDYFNIFAEDLPVVEMSFNLPQEMKAAYLVPGTDFLKTTADSADTVKKQIDDALANYKKYSLNTVIMDTVYGEQVIYNTAGANAKFADFDVAEYITAQARSIGLYVYAILDTSHYSDITKLDAAVSAFAAKYQLDGILADGYEGEPDSASYAEYIKSGSSMGYDNFLNQRAATVAKTVSQAVRKSAPDTQAGILVNPVWANASVNAEGTNTTAEYTSLTSGYADTKRYIEFGWFDFIAVKATTSMRSESAPFGEIATWWSKLADKKSIPMYVAYPTSKVGADGWTSSSIQEQIAFAMNENAYRGAIYDSLKNIPGQSEVLAAVAVTPVSTTTVSTANVVKPAATAPAVTTPKPEPEPEPEISQDEELWQDFEDEEDYEDYNDEDEDYFDSEWDESDDDYAWLDELLGDDAYFSVSSADSTKYAVEIKADQAATYLPATKNRIPSPSMYPLPKGAVDYTNGKVVSFTSDGVKYKHLILSSGYRVDVNDVKKVDSGPKNNSISGLATSNKSGYTYITLRTKQKVTYSVSYTGREFIIKFDNTTSVPNASTLSSNPMFSKVAWSGGNKLTLTLAKTGGFMGYKGYYDGDNLVFRFNNPPSSIKNAKIYIDAGHGASDTGAIGKNPTVYEKDINAAIAKQLAAELESRGATVKLYSQSQAIRGPARVLEAEKWGADLIVSVHCNTSTNKAAKGTEAYYFYPFAKQLAANASLNASKQFGSANRGAKSGIFHITLSSQVPGVLVETAFMTNTDDYAKLLKASYHRKLAIGIANGVEGALKTAYTGTASNGTEFSSPGTASTSGSSASSSSSGSGSTASSTSSTQPAIDVSGIALSSASDAYMSAEYVRVYPGNKYRVEVISDDGRIIRGADFTWKSDNTKIATVDANGVITAKSNGDALITATGGGYTLTCEIEVSRTKVAVKGINLSTKTLSIVKGKTATLYANVLPANAADQEIAWSSSDTKTATVNEKGVVTARRAGKVTITAKAKSGGYTATCAIEVVASATPLEELTTPYASIEMSVDSYDWMEVEFYPQNTTDSLGLTYTSNSPQTVSVDNDGNIHALKRGTAFITATSTANSKLQVRMRVTVK